MWAVVGALLVLAPAASALEFDFRYEGSRIYASEVISAAAEIDYVDTAPKVVARIWFLVDEAQGIAEGDTIELEFAFANATFADNIRQGALSIAEDLAGCDLRTVNHTDGREGDRTVQFTVEANTAACTNSSPAFVEFLLTVPSLTSLSARAPVTVSVTIDAPGGSEWPSPDDEARTAPSTRTVPAVPANKVCAVPPTTPCTHIEGKVLSSRANALIRYQGGLTFAGSSTGTSYIDFDGGRTTFLEGATGRTLGSVRVGVTTAAACDHLGSEEIDAACVLQLDGREFSIARRGDGQGDLHVSVTGDFREDDAVWLELGEAGMQDSEMLEMQDDGSMSAMFSLTDVVGNARAATGEAGEFDREQGIATRTLRYMPNGEDPLRPTTFRSSFRVDFSDNAVTDKDPSPANNDTNVHATMYPPLVIEDTQHAYAIPGIGTDDIGNVRIKCEVATSCTVYLECDDAAGDSWFAELDAPIEGRATHVVRSSDIGEMLNVGEDGWEGMLSCSVLSTRQISVQLLTRAAGVLVNNTYIEMD